MTTNQKKYADELEKIGFATITEDHYYEMLCCLPPEITNSTKEKGFDAFLVGEPYTHQFCKVAKGFVPFFACFAQTSDGNYLKAGYMSKASFRKYFINNDF